MTIKKMGCYMNFLFFEFICQWLITHEYKASGQEAAPLGLFENCIVFRSLTSKRKD